MLVMVSQFAPELDLSAQPRVRAVRYEYGADAIMLVVAFDLDESEKPRSALHQESSLASTLLESP